MRDAEQSLRLKVMQLFPLLDAKIDFKVKNNENSTP